MPGFILHHTAAKIYIEQLPKDHSLRKNQKDQNAFFVGNLVPDTVSDKSKTHFWNVNRKCKFMQYPDIKLFMEKYAALMAEPACKGYMFHLYLDRIFLKEYVPLMVDFFDDGGASTDLKEKIHQVRVRKTGQRLKLEEYLSDQYYYGDYTRLNTWLMNKYKLDLNLDYAIPNPRIEEVEFKNVEKIIAQLKSYTNVAETESEQLKIFERESLNALLYKVADDFKEFE